MKHVPNFNQLLVIMGLLMLSYGQIYAQNVTENTEGESTSIVIKIVLAFIAAIVGAGLCVYISKIIKKNRLSNTSKTIGDNSPITNYNVRGDSVLIDNRSYQESINNYASPVTQLENKEIANFEQDKQTVQELMSLLNIPIVEEFLFGNNPNRMDNRLLDIRDAWYSKYYPTKPVFNDEETERVIMTFYVEFDKLILLCAKYYDPMSNSDRYLKIRGLICDSFDDRIEDEKHFEEVIQQIQKVEPLYNNMKKFIIKRYKINFK